MPSTPAIILCDARAGNLRIASLTPLDRLVVAAHRAGCDPITIVGNPPATALKRTLALDIPVVYAADCPLIVTRTLVAVDAVLVQPQDLAQLLTTGGNLVTRGGLRLPVGVVDIAHPTADLPPHEPERPLSPSLSPARRGGEGARRAGEGEPHAFHTQTSPSVSSVPKPGPDAARLPPIPHFDLLMLLPPVEACGVAAHVHDHASARQAERALWDSLTSASDGWVDKHFNRPIGRVFSKLLIQTPVSPNQVSILSILVGLLSGLLFADGSPLLAVWAAVVLQISAVIDCMDGDIARVVFKESPLGKWLDIAGDQVVHVCVFLGIAIGLWRAQTEAPVLVLGISAAVGVIISFCVVLRALARPDARQNSRLQRLMDATTNRDFSVLLLLLALGRKLEWFLWMAGVGVHCFWFVALALQARSPHPRVSESARALKCDPGERP